jgi:hypothetical protein
MKIYKMMIRPVVKYSSETWTLTAKGENNLRIFERQILRKIFGPVNIDNIWRIRNTVDIDKLIEGADTAGTCEYGNELSGSIKCGEFLDQLQNQLASQEGFCSME